MPQTEAQLENDLMLQLAKLQYERVEIRDEAGLIANLKRQLERLYDTQFSPNEFSAILNYLDKGGVFERATLLRDKFHLKRDDDTSLYIDFFNQHEWCKNLFQVTNQITLEGKYVNRYDVTLLINGIPMVQIELKRRGLELKEAFNQTNRYQRHSYPAARGLFNYIQIFVVSNGVNTKYYANNKDQSFKQTFFWADKDNRTITKLDDFADIFLEKCHIAKMIARFIVLHQGDKALYVMRPYQVYAVEAIEERVKLGRENGYIWHTTGSGKTLTSFKAAQILTKLPKVTKVVFVVDRADLDAQTQREFNAFKEGCVDNTQNTASLVEQFTDKTKPLIVTTIQKLNNALSINRYDKVMGELADKRIVFIFDECHRSQFGETHKKISNHFIHAQMFGFTGTPIFADNAQGNAMGKRTTKDLFNECLHKYVITDAIRDENVLKFSIEYYSKVSLKENASLDTKTFGIDEAEFFKSEKRLNTVVDWIIDNHNRKTHQRDFSSIFAVSSIDMLIAYYERFKELRQEGKHDLRVVTIFSASQNEEDKDANGLIGEVDYDADFSLPEHSHTREKLDGFIADYNTQYGASFSTKSQLNGFYNYYTDIGKRIKARDKNGFQDKDRVDILLVVNMFLTGFDAKKVNTLYIDKNLKYHGLIQAFSRTNRILSEVKSQGNIVSFRNLKDETDKAIALFANKNAAETILLKPYEEYVTLFNKDVEALKIICPTVASVGELPSEIEQMGFIKAFRALIRTLNVLNSFSQFNFLDLDLEAQEFEDYKSKYLDLYESVKKAKSENKDSIIHDIDFALELIQRDNVNVAYILMLLDQIRKSRQSKEEKEKKLKSIYDMLGSEPQLRSKRELIENFIAKHFNLMGKKEDLKKNFALYWNEQREQAFKLLCEEETLDPQTARKMIKEYHFSALLPSNDDLITALSTKPKILERAKKIERVKERLVDFIKTFDDDTGDI
jgi:type I restriction enzyme, R subunit